MERYPVNHDAPQTAQRAASARSSSQASPWTSPEDSAALLDLMHDLLGTQAEPDPLFFVETWTLGIDTATHNFQARHHNSTHTGPSVSPFRSFDFSVPLVFIQEASDFTSTSAGFSAAWKDAYGVSPAPHTSSHDAASQQASPHADIPFSTPVPGLPLTPEDACRLLGVAATSTRQQIKSAYRQLVRRYHPDRLEYSSKEELRIATDRMTSINEAYRLLCDQPIVH